ncbi:MAG TPA: prolyl oligopeptidase family serine peptidase [Abditibacteriaceae bacterium]|jgi:predicted esterase
MLASVHVAHAQAPNARTSRSSAAVDDFIIGGANATNSLDALRSRLEAAEKRVVDGIGPADAQNLALWRFKLEQARLLLTELQRGYTYAPWTVQNKLAAFLDRAETIEKARGDAVLAAPTQMHERAYIAANDGSAQPYWVFLPKGYSARQKYPLVVFLHGYDPNINKAEPWIPAASTWSLATQRNMIFAVPYGRRNSDFLQIGEDDTLRVLEEVQKRYSVDPNRTVLMGASMGGYGALAVGLHTPHLWAGLAPMAARTDIYEWLRLRRDDVLPWKRALYESDDPRTLHENALHLPLFLQHGAQDTLVPVAHSRLFYNDLRVLRYPVRYREITDGDHYIYWRAASYQLALDWAGKLRRAPAPRRIVYNTQNLRNNRAYWATIEAFETYGEAARLEVNLGAGNAIKVNARNVAAFTLQPPAELIEAGKPLSLEVNGKAQTQTYNAAQPIRWSRTTTGGAAEATYPGIKTPRQSGPIRECYRDPFLLVYGTRAAAEPTRQAPGDQANARRFAQEWQEYADGLPPIKADRDVTAQDRKNYNLILFGTRETNSLIAEAAERLPVELTSDGYRLNKEKFTADNLGLVLCYPSPFSNGRMIVVQSGTYWGAALPVNHKFDLLPDYIVFNNTFDISDATNNAIAAGYFDNNWQLPEESTATAPLTPQAATIAPTN